MKQDVMTRYFKYVRKTRGCWIWRGSLTPQGYGTFWSGSRTLRAHRFIYQKMVGKIPKGLQLDHLCRVRHCVNPKHLEVVSNRTNTLRGVGVTAKNAKKTHCSKGHPFEGWNLYRTRSGYRHCRTCRYELTTKYRQKLRALKPTPAGEEKK